MGGVRRGFVLTEIDDEPIDASDWFQVFQDAKIPFTMTFDTHVKLHAGNPFFKNHTKHRDNATEDDDLEDDDEFDFEDDSQDDDGDDDSDDDIFEDELHSENSTFGDDYLNFSCDVSKLPF